MKRACLAVAILLLGLTSCSKANGSVSDISSLRLGFYPNITHAAALVGIRKGIFQSRLGPHVTFEPKAFSAGPAVVEALFSEAIDAAYVGPSPAINAFVRSHGNAIRIVSGATSGGAFLVVKPEVENAEDLRGKMVASPQLGNTQDVALRTWLSNEGLKANDDGGGDVSIVPQENAQTLETFSSGAIAGAWVPEPWAARLIVEGGGKVLVDERDLWPDGRFVTTQVIVRTDYLREQPKIVESLLSAHVEATDFVNKQPEESQGLVNAAILEITGKKLDPDLISRAWASLTFTTDPVASSLRKSADAAEKLGLLPRADLSGIYDLTILNRLLSSAGKPKVSS